MSRYSIKASSASIDKPYTMPPADVRLILRSPASGQRRHAEQLGDPIPSLDFAQQRRRPLVARAHARPAAMVVCPCRPSR